MNDIQVTLRGNVASQPRQVRFDDGNAVTSFRLASTARRFDRERREWVDKGTTYVTVNCRRSIAPNAVTSVQKGNPVVVIGRLWERFWEANGRSGQTLEIEADTVGHDLAYGTATFTRVVRAERVEPDAQGDAQAHDMAHDPTVEPAARPGVVDVSGYTVMEAEEAAPDDLEAGGLEEGGGTDGAGFEGLLTKGGLQDAAVA